MTLALLLCWSATGLAAPRQNYLVIGVIASVKPGEGVVLLKSIGAEQAFAARVGQEVDKGIVIVSATREYVYFRIDQRLERIKVGEQVDVLGGYEAPAVNHGIDRQGNRVKITSSFRDDLVKNQLSKVMMQAASVPYYEGGLLVGFRLLEIDADSVFQRAGLLDDDIVTALNGQELSDVGRAVRVMQSMKDETHIQVTLIRKLQPMTIDIVIE